MNDSPDTVVTDEDHKPLQSPGLLLRTQRESTGVTQQAVSEGLHLTVHYIKALENDDYGKLPGLTFVKGYFRAYARFLNMDVETVLKCYEHYLVAQGLQSAGSEFSASGRGRSDQALIWALVAGVILVVGLAAGWWFFGRDPGVRSGASAVSLPAPAIQARPAPAPNALTQARASASAMADAAPVRDEDQRSVTSQSIAGGPMQPADAGAAVINATLQAREVLSEDGSAPVMVASRPDAGLPADAAVQVALQDNGTSPPVQSGAEESTTSSLALAVTDAGAESATVDVPAEAATPPMTTNGLTYSATAAGAREITLLGEGDDRMELTLLGSSWAEIQDANGVHLFNDMLRQGDRLVIAGTAPFAVLLGDARQVQASFNAGEVNLATLTRADNTARFQLDPENGAVATTLDLVE